MKTINLSYGTNSLAINIDLPFDLIEANKVTAEKSEDEILQKAFLNPIDSPRLKDMVSPKSKVGIIVSDKTRIFPKDKMLNLILEEIKVVPNENITIVIANGNHDCYSPEIAGIPQAISSKIKVVNHVSGDNSMNVLIGQTSNGTNVEINKYIAEADVKICVGLVKPHYFMGYAGGAKSLLPGVASFATIAGNHLMKSQSRCRMGIVSNNIARLDSEEAARLAKINFIFNVVLDANKKVFAAFSGDVVSAHHACIPYCNKVSMIKVKPHDVVIISSSFPLALNIYQTTKLVAPASRMINPNGVMIVATECTEGVGSVPVINRVIYEMLLKLYHPEGVDIFLVSSLAKEDVEQTFFKALSSVEEGIMYAKQKLGNNITICCAPKGELLLPINGEEKEQEDLWKEFVKI